MKKATQKKPETMAQFQVRIEAELAAIRTLAVARRAREEQATGVIARAYSQLIARCDFVLAALHSVAATRPTKREKK